MRFSTVSVFKQGVGALVLLFSLTACTTIDPYTDEPKTSNTAIGAGGGALLGAGVGALVDSNSGRGALIGAGVGALAGVAVGSYMDQQEAELRHSLRGTGVSVTRYGDDIVLNMPSNVTFDVGRSTIKPQFYEVLDSVAVVINKYRKNGVDIAGHTDNSGSPDLNQVLSEQRANSVASYLRKQGVNPGRMYAEGFGESRPIASNSSPAGRAQNRRVEITLTSR